ncbi:MAG: NAD(P)H-binding protein [Verrucomicrobiales bacterium]|jgi:NADH dehydrogenase|nr:NAD(P)H-binding protein [Verrucomicrobiales bacterium]
MILVTGGAGFVGREVVKQLLQDGHSVRVLARTPKRAYTAFHAYDCEIAEGDILDKKSLAHAMRGVKAVVHLVGIIREGFRETFEQTHVEGTRNVIAAAEAAGIKRYLHMSAIGTRPHAVARYHQTKWAAEQLVRESRLQWTIFHPSLIYGKDDLFTHSIEQAAKLGRGIMPVPFNGETILQPVAVGDVARAFANALANEQALGKAYDLCGEPLTLNEIVSEICRANELKPRLIPVPGEIVKTLAYFAGIMLPVTPLSYDQALMLEENHHGDSSAAEQDLGFSASDFVETLNRKPSQVELALA